jgi:hypothetical protein
MFDFYADVTCDFGGGISLKVCVELALGGCMFP